MTSAAGGSGVQPDQYFPDTGVNASPGFSAYSEKTQEDYEADVTAHTSNAFSGILGLCEFILGVPFFQGLSDAGDGATVGTTQGMFAGGQQFVDATNLFATGSTSTGIDPIGLLTGIKDAFDAGLQAITGLPGSDKILEDLFTALQNIPFLNVLGYGGPANIGDTAQATWDQLISGFVGLFGTGSTLPDLFNVGQIVSSQSALGSLSWDILGIRSNQSLFTGFAPTSVSNLNMAGLAFNKVSGTPTAPTVPVTQSTALTSWHRVAQAMDVGMVGWTGSGVTSITDFRINIWGMDTTTGAITVLHHSTNQAGLLSGTMQDNVYSLPAGQEVPVDAGDVIGLELHPIGAGTHNVVGDATWRNFSHATVVPRRWSSKRNGGTSTGSPSGIADASIDYNTTNVPFMEYGVTASTAVPLPHAPETRIFQTAGATSTVIPSWCNTIECVAVGGGGGGQGCGLLWGEGGDGGSWGTVQLTRGTTIPSGTTTLNITVGAGGAGADGVFGTPGNAGTASTVSGTGMTTLTAAGGAGGSAGNSDVPGKSPGNHTFMGVIYAGGVEASNAFDPGNAAGGGGAGSTITLVDGGAGARGAVWIRFIQ